MGQTKNHINLVFSNEYPLKFYAKLSLHIQLIKVNKNQYITLAAK